MNPARRILHIVSQLGPFDPAVTLRELALAQAMDGQRVEVIALADSRHGMSELDAAGIRCRVLRRRFGLDPFVLVQLTRHLQSGFDLVHTWDGPSLAFASLAGRVAHNGRLVATFTNNERLGLRDSRFPRRLLSRVDRFVFDHQSAGPAENRTSVIPSGATPSTMTGLCRRELLDHFQLPDETMLIVVATPLQRNCRVKDAIWCFELVRVLDERVRLLVVGDGPERGAIQRFARLVSDNGAILILGNQFDPAEIVALADVAWHPATAAAPLNDVRSALASGIPIIAADAVASRKLIDDGRNGFLRPLGDRASWTRTTHDLLTDAELSQSIGQAAAERATSELALAATLHGYAELYKELL